MNHVGNPITWVLIIGLAIIPVGASARGNLAFTSLPRLQFLQSDSKSFLIKLDLPDCWRQPVEVDGRSYQSIAIEGFAPMSEPGLPQLPEKGWLIAIPPESRVNLIVEAQQVQIIETDRILPVPRIVPKQIDPSAEIITGELAFARRYVEDDCIYQTNAFYPPTIAQLGERGRLRDQCFVQLLVRPVQYNPVAGVLRYTRSLKLTLTFEPGNSVLSRQIVPTGNRPESVVFEKLFERTFLNYEAMKGWRGVVDLRDELDTEQSSPAQSSPSYKVSVEQDGIYWLSYSDLQSAGIPVDVLDPRSFKLFNQDQELAIWVEGEGDGRFDAEDSLIFFGQKANTKYTNTNVYWLTFGGRRGRRMTEVETIPGQAPMPAAFPTTVHLEHDLLYQSRVPVVEGADHWYWNIWPSRDGAPLVYRAELRNLGSGSAMATLRANVQGFTTDANVSPDHHLRLFLNGQFLQDVYLDGTNEKIADVSFPQSVLVEGENGIRVEVPGDTGAFFDQGLVNSFEIDYAKQFVATDNQLRFGFVGQGAQRFACEGFTTSDLVIFDITDAGNVKRLINFKVNGEGPYGVQFQDTITTEKEYLAADRMIFLRPARIEEDRPSMLRSRANRADYILLTHRDFFDEVIPLAQHRTAQGHRTILVDVQDVYDEFGAGIFNAEAIRDFLAYAYANWQPPAPSFVLLVGDGTFDFKDNLGTGERTFIPPLLRLVSPYLGEAASDNRYVTISGDDILPDMFIGRLPVSTVQEARVVVNKILRYENETVQGGWHRRLMFVAGEPDNAGAFDLLSDIVADQHLPPSFEREKVYVKVTHPTGADARAALITGINQGRLIVNYIGHSGIQLWAERTGRERYFDITDLGALTNADRLPMVVSMSSVDAFFHYPKVPALSESMLRAEERGVIGWWGGTGLGLSAGHHLMDIGFFDAVFREGQTEIGRATAEGKMRLYQETAGEVGGFGFLIDTYVLLGDPALKLAVPNQ
ncbi:MAG: hypothetical protein HY314_16500 [Acidobacteria bacterium]|nr:hypothetical protein [Acidobacteriota bacterium]